MSAHDPRDAPSFGPRHEASLVGHAGAEQAFLDAWNSGRLPHAWLICGPPGIGKSTFAFRAARFALAQRGRVAAARTERAESLHVDPSQPVFARVASRGHADLFTVERSWDDKRGRWREEIVVDDVRDMARFFSMTAAEGGVRVAVIDAADDMNDNAANAALKTLEEPPENGLILMVASAPGRVPATLRSRCRILRLRPLAEADVVAVIERQRPDMEPEARLALARLAEGSPGRALSLAGADGLDLYRDLAAVFTALPRLDPMRVWSLADRVGGSGGAAAYAILTRAIGWWLTRVARTGAGAEPSAADMAAGEAETLRRLARLCALDRWIEVWDNLNRLATQAESLTLDRKQVVLNIFSSLEAAASAQRHG
jgi:DNA polymerase III subunit delta'